MKKMLCPQCLISNLYCKNGDGEILLVYVTSNYEVLPLKVGKTLVGFDLDTVYCLGCSWSGSPRELKV